MNLTEADYARALELWPPELMKRVRNLHLAPRWLDGGARLAFDEQHADGVRRVVVDCASGRRLSDAPAPAPAPPADADPSLLAGPGGRAALLRGHDLWLRHADGSERALTHDGQPNFAWGGWPEQDLRAVERSRAALVRPPFGCFWSPDGTQLLAQRSDERRLEPYPYLESVPADGSMRPKVHWVRQQLAGEPAAEARWALIDVDSGARIDIELPGELRALQIDAAASGSVFWSPAADEVVLCAAAPRSDHVALIAVQRRTGAVRLLHEERCATWYDGNTYLYSRALARVLPNERGEGRELLWYSQGDGWGHLYVVDLGRGGITRRLTEGAWAVQDVIHIADGAVFFTACGREPGRHPYHRHLYRIDIDAARPNQGLQLLTPEDADHPMGPGPTPIIAAWLRLGPTPLAVSPDGRWFVDTHSTLGREPVSVLRDARSGELVAELMRCDASALRAIGWQPPEVFSAKAADGSTDCWGVILKPRGFDPARRYPVVERIYAGPQIVAQPRNFAEGLANTFVFGCWSLAELGFVVVIADGPGTPCRSKAFHDMPFGNADRWGIAHHRAVIEGAAASRPWMDLDRVGVSGHSYGGYGTAMAMLLEPGFYKVGVSSAGMYDPMRSQASASERWFGSPDFGGGRAIRQHPDEVADALWEASPSKLADRLAGHLLLVYGDLDENIQPAALLAFSDALINAGKQFDQLCLPGRTHGFPTELYFQKRLWDYFVLHLARREPLRHLRLEAAAAQRTLM